MCVRVGEKCGWCKVGDTTQLAQQADLGVFGGLCEELEALCGMQARERRLMQYEITATVIRQLLQKSTACLPPNCAAAFKPAKKLPRNGSARAGFWI